MSKLKFQYYMDYKDDRIARFETESGIPVNVYVEDYHSVGDLTAGQTYEIELVAFEIETDVYKSEDDYYAAVDMLAATAMIPSGTFPAGEGEGSGENPTIIYSGKVTGLEYREEPDLKKSNYCLEVESLDISFLLFVRYEDEIREGYIVHGTAFLCGRI